MFDKGRGRPKSDRSTDFESSLHEEELGDIQEIPNVEGFRSSMVVFDPLTGSFSLDTSRVGGLLDDDDEYEEEVVDSDFEEIIEEEYEDESEFEEIIEEDDDEEIIEEEISDEEYEEEEILEELIEEVIYEEDEEDYDSFSPEMSGQPSSRLQVVSNTQLRTPPKKPLTRGVQRSPPGRKVARKTRAAPLTPEQVKVADSLFGRCEKVGVEGAVTEHLSKSLNANATRLLKRATEIGAEDAMNEMVRQELVGLFKATSSRRTSVLEKQTTAYIQAQLEKIAEDAADKEIKRENTLRKIVVDRNASRRGGRGRGLSGSGGSNSGRGGRGLGPSSGTGIKRTNTASKKIFNAIDEDEDEDDDDDDDSDDEGDVADAIAYVLNMTKAIEKEFLTAEQSHRIKELPLKRMKKLLKHFEDQADLINWEWVVNFIDKA